MDIGEELKIYINMENRYIIFGWDKYYPEGGPRDILSWAGTRREVDSLVRQNIKDWDYVQVLNINTKKIKTFSAHYLIDLEIWKEKLEDLINEL